MDNAYDKGIKGGFKNVYTEKTLLGDKEGSLRHFIIHSEKYSQEDMSIVMSAVSDWIKNIKKD